MSDALTRFILVRHGRTEYNAQNRLQGRMDIPLAERGVRQAEAVAPVIAGMDPDIIVCSPLTRARQTARRIGRACGIDPVPDDRLMEIDVGRWGGLRVADLRREAPNLVAAREVGKDFRRPGGETGSEVMDRIAGAMEGIAAHHPGQTVVVVSHGFALRTGICRLLGGDYSASRGLGGLSNCSWTLLDRFSNEESRARGLATPWRLRAYNCQVAGD
ncbi:histidine phosphatase family protein [Acidipropionibacterium jensenii]|uniref:histidine phosphatase family protein n=1 Tax=Acidipropionibacterium jensenii TaxID=1749 RepID=UPI00110A81D0|nr:histidine phosphatase family protein [Acidipropionibacterium jensenii]QCV89174.1 histidine phosphatase family protein [Acidipropionibacterium jensenii]